MVRVSSTSGVALSSASRVLASVSGAATARLRSVMITQRRARRGRIGADHQAGVVAAGAHRGAHRRRRCRGLASSARRFLSASSAVTSRAEAGGVGDVGDGDLQLHVEPGGAGEHRREDQEHHRRQQEGHRQRRPVAPEVQRHHPEHREAHAARLGSTTRANSWLSDGRRTRTSRDLDALRVQPRGDAAGKAVAVGRQADPRARLDRRGSGPRPASTRLRRRLDRRRPRPPSGRRRPRRSARRARPPAPSRRRAGSPTRSASRCAWSRSWVTSRTPTPSSFSRRSASAIASRAGRSTPTVGSSSTSSFGPARIAAAMLTRR